jgi:hypothetical protein
MALIPGLVVAAPEPARRRYGIFDAANGPIDLAPHGEGGGVRYVPVTCGEAYSYGINCTNDLVASPSKTLDGDAPEVETGVFAVLSTFNCGAPGYSEAEARRKVLRALEGAEQGEVERTFWTGEDPAGNDIGILDLEHTAEAIFPPATGVDDIRAIVAQLEDYAYRIHGYGYQAYIHAPARFAPWAADAYLIEKDGNRKVTPNGSVWVFGGGYPGTGAGGNPGYPDGGFLHITGQTTVWRSPEVSVYESFENVTNERLLVAERAYAVAYECFNARIEFNPLNLS